MSNEDTQKQSDIQALHMQNNAYRDFIRGLKEQINDYDRRIRANEREIGLQLEDMTKDSGVTKQAVEDCTLCMGECNSLCYGHCATPHEEHNV